MVKHEWIWPVTIALFGAGGSYAVSTYKTDSVLQDIEALEDRERSYIDTMARIAQNQQDLAENQEKLVEEMSEMNDKLDMALRGPRSR